MQAQLRNFINVARAAYEEAKINYNTGKCTAEQLENVRLAFEKLERMATTISSTDGKTL